MKKFSTAALVLALVSACATLAAPSAMAAGKSRCEFLANAPDSHLVVRGDTLWGISGKFLEHPWCWPEVWGLNRDKIRDPHWIYPGQIVYFDRVHGRLSLVRPVGDGSTVRLSPQVRMEGMGNSAIPAIRASDIEPFLTQPLIVTEDELKGIPRIVATQEGRVFLGKNDKAYVRGDLKDQTSFQVFRPGKPLKDPITKKIIGYEAAYLGSVKLTRAGQAVDEAHTFSVVIAKEEMGVGDRLVPVPPAPVLNYVPHPPPKPIDAYVASIYGGVANAGQNQIVAINRGQADGIDVGTVLELYRSGTTIVDKTEGEKENVRLPDEKYGTLFIFRVFNGISYGLIMQVTDSVQIGDAAKSPE
jgi:LysM domain